MSTYVVQWGAPRIGRGAITTQGELMQDPKYHIEGGRLHHTTPNYPIPEDEPIMILRGKDPIAIKAIIAYVDAHHCPEHRASAMERWESFTYYQATHPDRVNTDCTKDSPVE